MKKSFEEVALEIIKTYLDAKQTSASNNHSHFNIDTDYELNSVDTMTNKVTEIADRLADNYRHRAIEWDKSNFDREVDKLLTEDKV